MCEQTDERMGVKEAIGAEADARRGAVLRHGRSGHEYRGGSCHAGGGGGEYSDEAIVVPMDTLDYEVGLAGRSDQD